MTKTQPILITPRPNLTRFRSMGSYFGLGLFFLLIVMFAGSQLYRLVRGPQIKFSDNIMLEGYNITKHNIFELSGTTNKVAYLFINDREQSIRDDGSFDFSLYIPYGGATIKVVIQDRYRRTRTTNIAVYNPASPLDTSERATVAEKILGQEPGLESDKEAAQTITQQ